MKLLPTGIHDVPGAETDVFTVRSPNCVANATQGAIILKLAPAWATTHDGIVGRQAKKSSSGIKHMVKVQVYIK
ncbi:MAG: hypothetical protein Q8Q81_10075 [Oxalobacteraceae bacterium]|nr:hypothetical protein [Oxalobacteraceae bacterium]